VLSLSCFNTCFRHPPPGRPIFSDSIGAIGMVTDNGSKSTVVTIYLLAGTDAVRVGCSPTITLPTFLLSNHVICCVGSELVYGGPF
jgi:hypothetical protein